MGLFKGIGNYLYGDGTPKDFSPSQTQYGLNREQFRKAGVGAHLQRAYQHSVPKFMGGSGRIGENLLNSVGKLTAHQKATSPFMSRLTVQGLPAAFALYGMANGDDLQDTLAFAVAPGLGMAAYGTAAEIGFAASKAVPLVGRWAAPVLGRAIGGIAAIGVAAAGAAAALSTDNDTVIKRTAQKINKGSFMGSQMETRGTLTHRQKMLNKLAKSGLNDRGALMRK